MKYTRFYILLICFCLSLFTFGCGNKDISTTTSEESNVENEDVVAILTLYYNDGNVETLKFPSVNYGRVKSSYNTIKYVVDYHNYEPCLYVQGSTVFYKEDKDEPYKVFSGSFTITYE